MVEGDYIHVSGTVGADPETGEMPEDAGQQARNIFRIVKPVLEENGSGIDLVIRNRVFLTDIEHLQAVAEVLRENFADNPPANTTLLTGIPAPGAKVEIEITAKRRDA